VDDLRAIAQLLDEAVLLEGRVIELVASLDQRLDRLNDELAELRDELLSLARATGIAKR